MALSLPAGHTVCTPAPPPALLWRPVHCPPCPVTLAPTPLLTHQPDPVSLSDTPWPRAPAPLIPSPGKETTGTPGLSSQTHRRLAGQADGHRNMIATLFPSPHAPPSVTATTGRGQKLQPRALPLPQCPARVHTSTPCTQALTPCAHMAVCMSSHPHRAHTRVKACEPPSAVVDESLAEKEDQQSPLRNKED